MAMKRLAWVALFVPLLLGLPSAATAKYCTKMVVGSSEGATPYAVTKKADAIVFAKQSWRQRCKQSNGAEFCTFNNAERRELLCNRVPNGFGGWNHICIYKGKPCKP